MYKLEKIKIDEGKVSGVPVGMSAESVNLVIIGEDIEHNTKLTDIKLDVCILVSGLFTFVRTSPISKIISSDDKKVVFKTKSSTYELSLVENA